MCVRAVLCVALIAATSPSLVADSDDDVDDVVDDSSQSLRKLVQCNLGVGFGVYVRVLCVYVSVAPLSPAVLFTIYS